MDTYRMQSWDGKTGALLFILSKQSQGFSSLKELATLESFGSPLIECDAVDEHTYSLSDLVDEFMRLVTYYMFERLWFLILYYDFSMKSKN